MLIKITAILIVISLALYIIAKMYFRTLSAGGKLRLSCVRNYKTGENIFFTAVGIIYMITFVMVVVTVISSILKYL